jgi:N-acetylglucosamine-6-phosphate deacetylase
MTEVALPGFFDLQVNGFAGVDFNDPATSAVELQTAIGALRTTGVTRFLPTLITAPLDRFVACARQLARCPDPAVAGIHLEGPYLAEAARGAHPAAHLRPATVDDFCRRQDAAAGRIVLVTLAPEVPGALTLIEWLVARGVRVAVGHTMADAACLAEAVRAGAVLSTHLGNGCPPLLPRHPNPIWDQLAEDGLHASLIGDGHHLPAAVIKVMVRAKGPDRIVLVTDAIAAAARPPGRHRLGDVVVDLSPEGRVTVAGTDRLAGSAGTLDAAVGRVARWTGLPLPVVAAMASTTPAALLGLSPAGRVIADWDSASGRLAVLRVEELAPG